MTSIDAQLEANGYVKVLRYSRRHADQVHDSLPTHFQSTSIQPEVDHVATNAAAIISNAEASEITQHGPGLSVAIKDIPSLDETQPEVPKAADVPTIGANGRFKSDLDQELQPSPNHVTTATRAAVSHDAILSSGVSALVAGSARSETPLLTKPLAEPTPLAGQILLTSSSTDVHAEASPSESVPQTEPKQDAVDGQAVDAASAAMTTSTPVSTTHVSQSNGLPSLPPAPQPSHTELPLQVPQSNDHTNSTTGAAQGNTTEPTSSMQEPGKDQEMVDAPLQPAKPVRPRDEDTVGDERASKRVKIDEGVPMADQSSFKVPESPASAMQPTAPAEQDPEDVVTPLRLAHMKRVISNLKKSNASTAFRLPVDYVTLNIPSYPSIVTNPMDLGTIDNKLKQGAYKSVKAFIADFEQIIANVVLFNGAEHAVTQQGRKMEASFRSQMANLPRADADEQSKKAMKLKVEPVRAPPPRRPSVSSVAKAASPKTTPSSATFAPDPNGMPLLRRDSALDGRPKRAIVPTKRNSDFGAARPKKKKYELELRFCDEVLKTISSPKYWVMNQYFLHPVDPVALNIPTYFQIIKKPMDLGTMRQKLDGGQYERAKDFEEDFRLICKNCYKFNPEGDYVRARGEELEKLFNAEWAKKQDWIMAREPDSDRGTPAEEEDDDDSSDEDEDEADDSGDDRQKQIKKLQEQIDAMARKMSDLADPKARNKKSPGVTNKKDKKKKDKPATSFPNLKPKEKPKKPAKAKAEKDRYVTFAEKQYISNGIQLLPERQMSEALKIIQNSVPHLANSAENEIELDIEEVPNHALLKLLTFVRKYAGPPPEEMKQESEASYAAPTTTKKKNKTLSRQEQEQHIAELRGTLQGFSDGNGTSPGAMPSIEQDDDSGDDSGEESEEE